MTATILPFVRPKKEAIMALQSRVPSSAMTAQLLGTERSSNAVQITADGLLLTMGYAIMEASEIWLTNRRGQTSAAIVLAHDYDSGLALLKPVNPLGRVYLETASSDTLSNGADINILTSESDDPELAQILTIEEYAGRWEYLLENAIYTMPLCDDWSGAALLNNKGKLCGIGCLALGLMNPEGNVNPGNLFVPVDLVMPHIEQMILHGKKSGAVRPWLGALFDERESRLHVIGLYQGGPAAEAGVLPGDIILRVDQQDVNSLADFFRCVWNYGPAGSSIPLVLSDGKDSREVELETIDRESFFVQHSPTLLN